RHGRAYPPRGGITDVSELADLFHSEAAEYLQLLNDSLLELERGGDADQARAQLDEMFRAAHSLKGMSATMGYTGLARLTHRMEDLLDLIRKGKQELTPVIADLLFEGLDALEAMLANPEGAEPDPDLMERFAEALEAAEGAAAEGAAGEGAAPESGYAAAHRVAPAGADGAGEGAEAAEDAGAGPGAAAGVDGGTGAGARLSPAAGPTGGVAGASAALGVQPGHRLFISITQEAPMQSVRGHIVLWALEN